MLSCSVQFTWHKQIEQAIKNAAKKVAVGVGIVQDAKYPNGKRVSDIAMAMEFGTTTIPPRPFLRRAIAADKDSWSEQIGKKLSKVAKGKKGSERMAFKAVGEQVKESIVQSIEMLTDPALAPMTIATKAAKGSSHPEKPLIDTGLLKDSFQVAELIDD